MREIPLMEGVTGKHDLGISVIQDVGSFPVGDESSRWRERKDLHTESKLFFEKGACFVCFRERARGDRQIRGVVSRPPCSLGGGTDVVRKRRGSKEKGENVHSFSHQKTPIPTGKREKGRPPAPLFSRCRPKGILWRLKGEKLPKKSILRGVGGRNPPKSNKLRHPIRTREKTGGEDRGK